jgi:hypothetical protein
MTHTVTALFHSEQHATAAASRLKQAGIPGDHVDIWSTPHNLAPLLQDEGVSRTDAQAYVEGVIRGGLVVIVRCDDTEADQVVNILDQEGVLDLEEQQVSVAEEQDRAAVELAEGLSGSSGSAQADTDTGDGLDRTPDMTRAGADTDGISQFKKPGQGRVRVHSRKVERPLQE